MLQTVELGKAPTSKIGCYPELVGHTDNHPEIKLKDHYDFNCFISSTAYTLFKCSKYPPNDNSKTKIANNWIDN